MLGLVAHTTARKRGSCFVGDLQNRQDLATGRWYVSRVDCPNEAQLLGYVRDGGAHHRYVMDHVTKCDSCEQLLVAFGELSASRAPDGAIEVPDEQLPGPGEVLGRYELRSTIGRGAMGIVYLAHDPKLDRDVALKLVLKPQRSALEEARLLLEARAAARVHDPHLVSVYDVGAWHGRVFLAMEHVDGPSLTRWLAEQPRHVDAILRVFADVARGLAVVHAAGLAHCDVKPDNILIGATGAKLGDFGLAVGPDEPDVASLRGTPMYMAPELLRGAPPSAAGDQYAWCLSLFEAIAGRRPERGAPVRPPRMARWLYRIVSRGLAVDPARRFGSMREIVGELERRRSRVRRQIAIAATISAIATAGTIAAIAWMQHDDRDPCPAAQAELARAWPAARRSALTATLGPKAIERLDAYGSAWLAAGVSACRATRVSGRYSEAVLDRRAQCLDRARSRFAALVELLLDTTTPHEHALAAIDELPDLAACDNTAALGTRAPPTSPVERARFVAATSIIDHAMEQIDLRRPDAALAKVRSMRGLVASLAADPAGRELAAEAHYMTGLALAQRDQRDEAVATFEQAYEAARAAANERLEVQIALELAGILDREPATRPTAKTWLGRARGVADRLDDAALTALVAEREGSLAYSSNDYASAVRALRAALQLRSRRYGDTNLRTALTRSSLASALNKTGNFDEARREFQRAMTDLAAARGDNHPSLVTIWNGLANVELAVGNVAAARDAFTEARRRAVLARGEMHGTVIALDINLAAVARRSGDLDQAQAGYERAIAALERSGRRGSSTWRSARQGFAQVTLARGNIASARQLLEELIAERLTDKASEPAALGSLRIDLADALTKQRRFAAADAELVAARSAYVGVFGERHPKVARIDLQRAANAFAARDAARAERFAIAVAARSDLPVDIQADAQWFLANVVAKTRPARARELASSAAKLAAQAGDRKLTDEITQWLARRKS